MKTLVIAAMTIVTFTIAANSEAEAQGSFYGANSYPGVNSRVQTSPYLYNAPTSNYVLPASYSYPGTSGYISNGNCPNGQCGIVPAPANCPNGRCGYGSVSSPATYHAGYRGNNGPGLGSTLGSWFGLRPAYGGNLGYRSNVGYGSYGNCANGRCSTFRPSAPYQPHLQSPGPSSYDRGAESDVFYDSY